MIESEWLVCEDPIRMAEWLMTGVRGVTYDDPTIDNGIQLVSDRKLRLWAVTCCRQVWHLLNDKRSRRAVELAERYADGEVDKEDMRRAWEQAQAGIWKVLGTEPEEYAFRAAWFLADYWPSSTSSMSSVEQLQQAGQSPAFQAALLHDIVGNPFRPVNLDWLETTPDLCATIRTLARTAYADRDPLTGHLDPLTLLALADALEEAGCPSEDHPPCPACGGRGGWWDDEAIDQWYRCSSCRGTGRRRYRHEVLEARQNAIMGGCCGRFADQMGCDCLSDAAPDPAGILAHLRSPGPHVRGCHVVDLILGKE